jgi:hypothetical protein
MQNLDACYEVSADDEGFVSLDELPKPATEEPVSTGIGGVRKSEIDGRNGASVTPVTITESGSLAEVSKESKMTPSAAESMNRTPTEGTEAQKPNSVMHALLSASSDDSTFGKAEDNLTTENADRMSSAEIMKGLGDLMDGELPNMTENVTITSGAKQTGIEDCILQGPVSQSRHVACQVSELSDKSDVNVQGEDMAESEGTTQDDVKKVPFEVLEVKSALISNVSVKSNVRPVETTEVNVNNAAESHVETASSPLVGASTLQSKNRTKSVGFALQTSASKESEQTVELESIDKGDESDEVMNQYLKSLQDVIKSRSNTVASRKSESRSEEIHRRVYDLLDSHIEGSTDLVVGIHSCTTCECGFCFMDEEIIASHLISSYEASRPTPNINIVNKRPKSHINMSKDMNSDFGNDGYSWGGSRSRSASRSPIRDISRSKFEHDDNISSRHSSTAMGRGTMVNTLTSDGRDRRAVVSSYPVEISDIKMECPLCRSPLPPMLHVRSYVQEPSAHNKTRKQPRFAIDVPYMSPRGLRAALEEQITKIGERVAHPRWLHGECPTVYWNLVWYTSRFNMPAGFLPGKSMEVPQDAHLFSGNVAHWDVDGRVLEAPVVVGWHQRTTEAKAKRVLYPDIAQHPRSHSLYEVFADISEEEATKVEFVAELMTGGNLVDMRQALLLLWECKTVLSASMECDSTANSLYIALITIAHLFNLPIITGAQEEAATVMLEGVPFYDTFKDCVSNSLSAEDLQLLHTTEADLLRCVCKDTVRNVRLGMGMLY